MTVCILLSRFVHPRFGPIKCIRTLRAVEADEELTVAYGYDHSPPGKSGPEAPEWYQVELKAFQATQQKWTAWLWASETWNRNLDLCTTFLRQRDNQGLLMLWHHILSLRVRNDFLEY